MGYHFLTVFLFHTCAHSKHYLRTEQTEWLGQILHEIAM